MQCLSVVLISYYNLCGVCLLGLQRYQVLMVQLNNVTCRVSSHCWLPVLRYI